jgi:hypothetical protein
MIIQNKYKCKANVPKWSRRGAKKAICWFFAGKCGQKAQIAGMLCALSTNIFRVLFMFCGLKTEGEVIILKTN